MATVAYLSDNHVTSPEENPRAFGTISDGWIVKNSSVLISDVTSAIADGPHNAFDHASTSGFDVTIDTGEAMVSGSPIGKDTTTTVTLASSTAGQTVYVGFEPLTQDSVVVGLDAAFSASAVRIPIWEFDTGSSTVTASTDLRDLGSYVNVPNRRYETVDGTGTAVDTASQLGGIDASNYARTDQSATFSSSVDANGQLTVTDASKQISLVESDTSTGHWVIDVSDGFLNFLDNGSTNRFRLFQAGGFHLFNGEMVGARLENRTARPSGTNTGRIIYRTDKE